MGSAAINAAKHRERSAAPGAEPPSAPDASGEAAERIASGALCGWLLLPSHGGKVFALLHGNVLQWFDKALSDRSTSAIKKHVKGSLVLLRDSVVTEAGPQQLGFAASDTQYGLEVFCSQALVAGDEQRGEREREREWWARDSN